MDRMETSDGEETVASSHPQRVDARFDITTGFGHDPPIAKLLVLPFGLPTLRVSTFVINALMPMLTDWLACGRALNSNAGEGGGS